MRLAIISDIHSNLEALTEALTIISAKKIDDIICLGDTLGYGANPRECLSLVQSVTGHILRGNHDEASVDISKTEYFNRYARFAAEWTHKQLTPEEMEFIKRLPSSIELYGLLFTHSSPFEPDEWHYIVSYDDAKINFPLFSAPVCFIGHSHLPGIYCEDRITRDIVPGKKYIINVGSVGQPRDNDPRLSFGLFDTETLKYENIRAEYDIDSAAEKIIKAGLPKSLALRLYDGK